MATTLTRNLKLRINSGLTADSKYNLERLDLLGSTFLVDSTNQLNIRSQTDILIEPESADVDGSGIGGDVSIGTASHIIDNLDLWATSVTVPVSLGLKDQATGGTKYLRLKYKTDVNGSADTVADRSLLIDLEGADRLLLLQGNYKQLGGDLTLNLSGTTSVILPQTGTLSTLAGVETLTNKSIDGLENVLTNIQYSSLNLTDSITNADVNSAAAIAYSKLNLSSSITNSDISGTANILYSKLFLTNSIVNADINSAAAISYSKLNLASSITNADISSSAGISRDKIGATSPDHVLINDATGLLSSEAQLSISRGGTGASTADAALNALLPQQSGNAGKFLQTDGTSTTWATVGGVSGVASFTGTWNSGTSTVINHGLNSTNVVVSVIDDQSDIAYVDIEVTDANNITLTSSEAPVSPWTVVVHAEG